LLSGRAVGVAQPVLLDLSATFSVCRRCRAARVSTAAQNADLQIDELTSAGCYEVFVDRASEVLDRCPELDNVLERLRPGTPWWSGGWAAEAAPCAI